VHQRAAERAHLVDVGRGFFAARGVEEVEGLAFGRERTRHAQQRRDADAACDEQRWRACRLCSAKSLRGACAPSTAPSTSPCIQAEPPVPCGSRSTAIS
jgi:hypothetical protein